MNRLITNEIKEKIEQIKVLRAEYNLPSIPTPISEEEVNHFIEKFEDFFNQECDDDFIDFLKVCDGLEENGFTIFSSYNYVEDKVHYGIFENNQFFYEQDEEDKQYVLFVTSGQDLYVFNKENSKYELLDRYSGDVYETFNSFNEMLLYVLKLMLDEEVD